ncbi:MAG: excinuclease ABC subunit UvrA [Nitrospirae bacterium]|nr:excinuclease ABC subunit UvrA [Nitrospirota bacterium]
MASSRKNGRRRSNGQERTREERASQRSHPGSRRLQPASERGSITGPRIVIRGAREHNLKNVDLAIPRDKLVVLTGVSGSGKSSLAFDTLYAEGQRRYVESLSAYARQFLEQMDKPDVEAIEGLSPAISIEQKTVSKNPRSTVATVTEIYDYLRLLFARAGTPHCYQCGKIIHSQTVQQMADRIRAMAAGTRFNLLAPIVQARKGEYRKELEELRKGGFARVKVDGHILDLADPIELDKNKKHDIELVVDRLVVKPELGPRLTDSLETALKFSYLAPGKSGGLVRVEVVDEQGKLKETHLFSERYACVDCGISYPEMTPRMFSFNSPQGACPECTGLGTKLFFDPRLVVPSTSLSLREGAIAPWQDLEPSEFEPLIQALGKHYGFSIHTPFKDLSDRIQKMVLFGSGSERVDLPSRLGDRRERTWAGVIPQLEERYRELEGSWHQWELERYMGEKPCPLCKGARVRKESLAFRVSGKNIHEVVQMSILHGIEFFGHLTLGAREQEIAKRVLKEIVERLRFLVDVGLDYLTLDRPAATLSGGEGQRIRLASQIGSHLVGVLYVLDEPSIGLHQKDNRKLLQTLCLLRDLGNSVVVVEHDEETIRTADYVVDLGPGAGVRGGEVVFAGNPKELEKCPDSLTGRFLCGKDFIPVPAQRRAGNGKSITLVDASANNLKNLTVSFPLGEFICITGVSGSGKSSLVLDTLYRAMAQKLFESRAAAGPHRDLVGAHFVDKVIDVDQSPIGRTPRSNPATYTGLFTPIRELFAQVPESRSRGYKAGRFSFNVKGGRCETCEGDGVIKIEMHFLPDVYVVCEECKGRRYNRETLQVLYKGRHISEVLSMTVDEALVFFENIPAIREKLRTLVDVGLGYVKLGQAATTLSGGEAQRVKLSKELSRRSTGRTLYILDEPTTGLHFADIRNLLRVLHRLVELGNTVIVIEHNFEVIKTADHIIDLGPDGGDAGGKVVALGTPEAVAKVKGSYTGQYLVDVLRIGRQGPLTHSQALLADSSRRSPTASNYPVVESQPVGARRLPASLPTPGIGTKELG